MGIFSLKNVIRNFRPPQTWRQVSAYALTLTNSAVDYLNKLLYTLIIIIFSSLFKPMIHSMITTSLRYEWMTTSYHRSRIKQYTTAHQVLV